MTRNRRDGDRGAKARQKTRLNGGAELQEQGELNEKIIMELRDLKITEGKTDIL